MERGFGFRLSFLGTQGWTRFVGKLHESAKAALTEGTVYELRLSIPYSIGNAPGAGQDIGWYSNDAIQGLDVAEYDPPVFVPPIGIYLIGRFKA